MSDAGPGLFRRRPPRAQRTVAEIILREGSALVFSAALLYMLWWDPIPAFRTPDEAMWYVCGAGVASLIYVLSQAISAVSLPIGRETGPLGDLLISLIPVFVLGYTVIDWIRQGTEPSAFQIIIVVLASIATFVDVIIFTWFSLRLNRLAPEIVPIE